MTSPNHPLRELGEGVAIAPQETTLARLLDERQHLEAIVTSANIDAERFGRKAHEASERSKRARGQMHSLDRRIESVRRDIDECWRENFPVQWEKLATSTAKAVQA